MSTEKQTDSQTTSDPAVASSALLAWEVELHSMTCICFAATKAKAQMMATKSYWEAYGRQKGEWPRARAWRKPIYDNSALRFSDRQRAWTLDHVRSYPTR